MLRAFITLLNTTLLSTILVNKTNPPTTQRFRGASLNQRFPLGNVTFNKKISLSLISSGPPHELHPSGDVTPPLEHNKVQGQP